MSDPLVTPEDVRDELKKITNLGEILAVRKAVACAKALVDKRAAWEERERMLTGRT